VYAKDKRIKDEDTLDEIRQMECSICGKPPPSDPDHWRTRKAGFGDTLNNLLPLCRRDHTLKHQIGIKTFWRSFKEEIQAHRDRHGLPPLDIFWE
jgi:hypothetical protein